MAALVQALLGAAWDGLLDLREEDLVMEVDSCQAWVAWAACHWGRIAK